MASWHQHFLISDRLHSSPPPIPPSRSSLPGLLRVLALLLALGLLLITIGGGYHWWLGSKIKHHLAAVRATGKPVTLAELNAYYPEVAPASNAALVYGRAFELLLRTKSAKFLEHLEELPSGTSPLASDIREQMEAACQENADTLEALDQAARLSLCRYPVDYTPGWEALLPHLRHLRKCSALEMSRGALAEQRGDIRSVIHSIEAITRFSGSLDTEPDLISVLVQHRMEFHAAELLQWLLNHRQVSVQQLVELQQVFQSVNCTNRLDRALVGERCSTVAIFDYSAGQVLNVMDPSYEDRLFAVLGIHILRLSGTWNKDEIRYLECINDYSKALRLPLTAALDRAETIATSIKTEARQRKFIVTGMLLPPFSRGFQREAMAVARQRLVQTSLALERYRSANGQLPTSLHGLAPNFMSAVSIDPFSGEEFLYQRGQEGYVIYSVGPDRRDDGGTTQVPRDSKEEHPSGDIIFAVAR